MNESAVCWTCHGVENMEHPENGVILSGPGIREHFEQGHEVEWSDPADCDTCGGSHPNGYEGDCRNDRWRLA